MRNKRIRNKDIAELIHKTPSAISYVKRTNKDEFEILLLGSFCMMNGISLDDLKWLRGRLYDRD